MMGKGKYNCGIYDTFIDTLSFVEFETGADLKTAVEKLDGREFKGSVVHCISDVSGTLHIDCITKLATGSR